MKTVKLLLVLIPVALVVAGIYILLQPDVVTQQVTYSHSSGLGLALVLLGVLAAFLTAIVVIEP